MISEVVESINDSREFLLDILEGEQDWKPSEEFLNYPPSAIYAEIVIDVVRSIDWSSQRDQRTISILRGAIASLKDSYDFNSNNWDSSPLATARALTAMKIYDSITGIDSMSRGQTKMAIKFIKQNANQDKTWKGELPVKTKYGGETWIVTDYEGEIRYATSEILLNLKLMGKLSQDYLRQSTQTLMSFYENVSDSELVRNYNTAYTARPLYNLYRIGAISDDEPICTLFLRFLLDLDIIREEKRQRKEKVIETVHALKLILRVGLGWPQKKIEDAIKWLCENQADRGWNRGRFDPYPSPFITATVTDVLCDYIKYKQLRTKLNTIFSGPVISPRSTNLPGEGNFLASLWDAVEIKVGLGPIKINFKKLIGKE